MSKVAFLLTSDGDTHIVGEHKVDEDEVVNRFGTLQPGAQLCEKCQKAADKEAAEQPSTGSVVSTTTATGRSSSGGASA